MSTELDVTQDQLPQTAAESGGNAHIESAQRNPLLRLLTSARRHWLLVLMVWLLVGVPAFAAIWLLVKPTYTASAFIEVAPAVPSILYPDERQNIGGFDAFLNTQAQTVTSSRILTAALADPNLKGLPLLSDPEPIAALREDLNAAPIKNTHLIRVSVEQADPDAAKRLTTAVMKAYEAHANANELSDAQKRRKILEDERRRLRGELDTANTEIQKLAAEDGTSSQATFEVFRETIIKLTAESQRDLDHAEAELAALRAQRGQLDEGLLPTTMPAEDLVWREQEIEKDPMVWSLRGELAEVSMRLIRSGQTEYYQGKKDQLEARLEAELARAADSADSRLQQRRGSLLDQQKRRVGEQIEAADTRVALLKARVKSLEDKGLELGRRGLDIQKLQKQAEITDRDFRLVDEELRKMEIEKWRPTRITVDASAEIRPDDIQDKRKKFAPVALVGGLGLGLMLALVIDLLRGRVHSTDDVEAGIGLPLLGSLPSLHDLQRGRVSEQDFREGYRLIRATLAGASPDGRIPRTLLVTSAQAAEGKTSLAISLAASLAETGARVLLIDGDVQAPRVGQTLKLAPQFTLRHVLLGERCLTDSVHPTPVAGLDVLLAGRNGSSAGGLLTGDLAVALLKSAATTYDHVVIDSPPALGAADATIWAQVTEGVIFSSLAGHSSLKLVRHACLRLGAAGGRILGGVLCNVSLRESRYSYSSMVSRYADIEEAGDTKRKNGSTAPRSVPCVHLPECRDTAAPAQEGAAPASDPTT